MIEEVRLGGYTTDASDYGCPDGDLAQSLNVIEEDGVLKMISKPKVELKANDIANGDVKYIHKGASEAYENFIIDCGVPDKKRVFKYRVKENDIRTLKEFDKEREVYQVTSIGNTLLILTDEGTHYFLWKGPADANGYVWLGTKIPEIEVHFGLVAEKINNNYRGEKMSTDYIGDHATSWDNKRKHDNSYSTEETPQNNAWAIVNKVMADKTREHKFTQPFFVRYAYRLYDGSVTMASAPIFMPVCTQQNMYLCPKWWDNDESEIQFMACYWAMWLMYNVKKDTLEKLRKWSDIVTSVDFFISKPIYTIDINAKITEYKYKNSLKEVLEKSHSVYSFDINATEPNPYYGKSLFNFTDTAGDEMQWFTEVDVEPDPEHAIFGTGGLIIPTRPTSDIEADIRNCHDFYLLRSLKLDQLHAWTEKPDDVRMAVFPMPEEENYMVTETLVQKENLSTNSGNDYRSHDTIVAKYGYPYNSRLNLANARWKLWEGHTMQAMMAYCNDTPKFAQAYVKIKGEDGVEYVVTHEDALVIDAQIGSSFFVIFLFYPNRNAQEIWFALGDNDPKVVYNFKFKPHDYLNGAYWMGWENVKPGTEVPPVSPNAIENVAGKIFTSLVNNPFVFPLTGINTVGMGAVTAMATATKALSQGQFGQFPLYAFTNEGVWALEVGANGGYTSVQPMTRDVCLSADAITSLDNAVLFVTNRGIMLLEGSNTMCISDTIAGTELTSVGTLNQYDKVQTAAGFAEEKNYIMPADFIKEIAEWRMLYDYRHQRVVVYNSAKVKKDGEEKRKYDVALVYSMTSKKWGMMECNVLHGVNSYPESYAMVEEENGTKNMVDFCQEDYGDVADGSDVRGLVVTRPLKLSDADALKTVHEVICRGFCGNSDVQLVLWGSRDLENWRVIRTSATRRIHFLGGSPFKYFRLGMVLKGFGKTKSVSSVTIDVEKRMENRLR